MSDIARRPNRTPRRVREKRAFQLIVVGGGAAAVAVVSFVLALVDIGSLGITFLAAIIAGVCYFMFKQMTTKR